MVTNKTSLWSIGNTTIRNPERIPGALKIFQMYYHNKKSFSGNQEQQGEFMQNLLTHTVTGEKITKANQIPIAEYEDQSWKDKQQYGRMWLSLMEYYGLINAYVDDSEKTEITETGELFLDYPELQNEIWLRQLLKHQFPHYKEQPQGITIRGGYWFLKLMIELDGLTDFELGLASLARDEDFSLMEKIISDYRIEYEKAQKNNTIKQLENKTTKKQILKYYLEDFEQRKKILEEFIDKVKNNQKNITDAQEELKPVVGLGKGSKTKGAQQVISEITELLKQHNYEKSKHIEIFENYYAGVKSRTVFQDYTDSNSRILKLSGYCNWVRKDEKGKSRLKILEQYHDFVKNTIDNLPKSPHQITNENEKCMYHEYLVNCNQPELSIDNELEKRIESMKKELKQLGSIDTEIKFKESKLVPNNRIIYNSLFQKLQKMREEYFIRNLDVNDLQDEINELIKNPSKINPIMLESIIWKAIAKLGGYTKHVSETRNFHLDSKFNQIFTAGGGIPDMQFHYPKHDEIIEVTKMQGLTQFRGEVVKTKEKLKPVPSHVSEHKFYNGKETNCIFIAPSIHEDTVKAFCKYSNKTLSYIVKNEEITFHVIPLTLNQFLQIFKKCSYENDPANSWIRILSDLHKITDNNDKKWMQKIENFIIGL